jgi:Flp pilus assembly protein CpaB
LSREPAGSRAADEEAIVQRRANVLVLVGLAVVLIGGGLVWATTRHKGGGNPQAATVSVVVANTDISSGSSGDDLVSSGKVTVKQLDPKDAQPNAINGPTLLNGHFTIQDIKKGTQLTAAVLRAQPLRSSSIAIPAGMNGVALTLDYTPAGAGYPGAGDTVNIYQVIRPSDEGSPGAFTKLLLSNVLVLDVSQQQAPSTNANVTTASSEGQGTRAPGTQITYLLALSPTDAEHVIFATSMNHLYFTIVHKGDGAATTPGVTYNSQVSAR